MVQQQVRKPGPVNTFAQFVVATGGRPLLRLDDDRLLRGPFDLAVTITDNAAVNADLTLQSVWDKRVQTLYGSSTSADIEGVIRIAGMELYANDAGFHVETPTLKASLDNLAYVRMISQGVTRDWPLRGHVREPWTAMEFHEAANSALTRLVLGGHPHFFERPIPVDLRTDQLEFHVDTAINWAGSAPVMYLRLFGHLAPRDYPGAMIGLGLASCGTGAPGANEALDPQQYAEITARGFGGPLLSGGMVRYP
jgi:hypothetical protein